MKLIYQILILTILISCQFNPSDEKKNNSNKITSKHEVNLSNNDTLILRDFFIDSLTVGKKGRNKLVARLYEITDSIFIRIEFYSREKDNWVLKNQYEFEKDGISGIDPKLSDFNNDSFLDFNYKSSIAARGANNVRRLFIYSAQGDSLILIKNSQNYPNIVYNKKLDCVDAWLIHGCSSQVFLKIKKDSLIDFAWIQLSNEITIYEFDNNRNKIEIRRDTSNKYGCYTRFENYKPLIEYKEYPNN